MKLLNDVLLDLVEKKIKGSVRLNLLSKNIKPTKKLIEFEIAKKMNNLADKLCELAWEV